MPRRLAGRDEGQPTRRAATAPPANASSRARTRLATVTVSSARTEHGGQRRRPVLEHAPAAPRRCRPARARAGLAEDVDRAREPVEPLGLVGPDEALEQPRPGVGRDVDRRAVDAEPPPNARRPTRAAERERACAPRRRDERRTAAPSSLRVPVAVAVPDEVQARARPQLDEVELVRAGARAARRKHGRSIHER